MTDFIIQNQESLIVLLLVVSTILFLWNLYISKNLLLIKKRSRSFFESKETKDLEDIIYNQIKKINEADIKIKKLIDANEKIKEKVSLCIQKVGVVRFNPFGDIGGNQSFAISLLDSRLNGIIILSLYSRDGVRIYSKSIKEGESEYNLSKEEKEAIKLAIENNKSAKSKN